MGTLQSTVIDLIDDGVEVEEMVQWGVRAGYAEHALRKTLSLILLKRGIRRRAPGAGPKPPEEARWVASEVASKYGPKMAPKILYAAYRIAVALKRKAREVLPVPA